MSIQLANYTDDSIKHLSIIEHIKLRPSAYVNNIGINGQIKLINEGISNSIDELENYNLENSCLSITIFYYKKDKSKYIVNITDNGRGIPSNKIKDIFTQAYTSGKFDTDSYFTSGGLLGIGAKVILALSDVLKVISVHDNNCATLLSINDKKDKNQITTNMFPVKDDITSSSSISFLISNRVFKDIDKFINSNFDKLFIILKKIGILKYNRFRIIGTLIEVNTNKLFTIFNKQIDYKDPNFDIMQTATSIKTTCISYFDSNSFRLNADMIKSSVLDIVTANNKYIKNAIEKDKNKLLPIMDKISFYIDNANTNRLKSASIHLYYFDSKHKFINILNELRNKKIAIVNNLIIEDNDSYHISILIELLKKYLSKYIEDKLIKDFLLSKYYKFPFIFLIDIQYSGAQFTGTTKHAFKDLDFQNDYFKYLNNSFSSSKEIFEHLYSIIKDDLTVQYNKVYSISMVTKSSKKILANLSRKEKFMNCLSSDRSKTELFLFEGDSAKSSVGRNPEIQALYSLSGKVLNGLTQEKEAKFNRNKLKNNLVFSDIIKLLNIEANSPNLSTLNFNRLFILADADSDGFHIASLIIGNLYLYNKYFIEAGHLYLVIPPLYSLAFKNNSRSLYIRSESELIYSLCKFVYYDIFSLIIRVKDKYITLPFESFVIFMEMVFDISREIEEVSKKLDIPSVLIEVLVNYQDILSKLIVTQNDINKISKELKTDMIYNEKDKILLFSIGLKDYIILLDDLNDVLYKRINPLLDQLNYKNIELYIKSKLNNNKIMPISIIQLFDFCKSLDNLYEVERFKGIGSMKNIDRTKSCMDPKTRAVYQISEIGDVDIIYGALGSKANYRKKKILINKESLIYGNI